ncbi:PREDICTED: carbohydrate sulfotransferase 11 [Cyprinodon variegatus]|uniref:carbohydrate sulfotransferase 11 n=1 Tax=Cyprinodon variegatus TaxID=28743 RepID=UPI000742A4C7|nr:PREDICTED: carbohydrate sulfotransferase 11 [Cyprinodon variegatus]
MKQSLGELMRMSRICRMLFATCLGSFILVIFYFQSMFQPVMQKNPFVVDGCCRKGSRNSLQDLYSPSQLDPSALHDPMEIPANQAHVPSNLKTLNQYSIAEINHRLKNYFKFLFVREPLERLVSAYRNKFTLKYNSSFHKRFGTRIIRRYRKNATQEALVNGDDVKFKEFIDYLVDPATQRGRPLNEHWQTVYQLCHPCHIHYDMVGKYETLEEDANHILGLVGVGESLRFPSYAKSTRTTDTMTAQFFSNISAQQQVQLYQLYRMDFLMFNYSIPSYLRLD